MPHDLRQTRQGVAIGAGPCRFEEVTVTALDGLPSKLGQQARDVVAGCGDQGRSAFWHRPAPRATARPGRPARPRGVHRRQRTVKRNPGQPLKRRAAELTEAGGACWTRPAASSGRRGGRPDASLAATIEPAEMPTKCALCRKSIPPCCPAPARKPDSHASPSVPPTPKTSTSGGFTHNECGSAVRRPPDEVASVHAP